MKKTYVLLSVLSALITNFNRVSSIHDSQSNQIPSCELIYKRFYYTTRLERCNQFLHHLEQHGMLPEKLYKRLEKNKYTRLIITKSIKEGLLKAIESKSLETLWSLWEQMSSYKHLDDDTFISDYIHYVFIVLYEATYKQKTTQNTVSCIDDAFIKNDIEEMLNSIDILIDDYKDDSFLPAFSLPPHQPTFFISESFTAKVSSRIYFLKRLSKIIFALKKISPSCIISLSETDTARLPFHNELIIATIAAIQKEKNLRPMLKLIHEFEQFKYIDDLDFFREFVILIIIITTEQLQSYKHHERTTKITIEQLAHLYMQLEGVPLEELLNATDMLINEMPNIIEHYEFNSDMSWRAWFKKYWWAPPLLIASILLKLIILHKAGSKIHSSSST
jgi:hypothetical protein